MYKSLLFIVVFSLNFNSAGKEAFMASKEKICSRAALSWGGGVGGEGGVGE